MILDFIYNFHPSRVLLDFGVIKIYWYGLFIFLGMISGFFTYLFLAKKLKIEMRHVFDSFFWSILIGLIGARLFYVFYYFDYYFHNPLKIVAFWDGGISILGGAVFGFLALFIYVKINKQNIFKFLNIASIALIVGQIFGRFGNYFNQELFGIPTNFFLKIPIDLQNRPLGFEGYSFFAPLFFYEILANIFILLILILYFKKGLKNNLESGIVMKNINVKTFRANMKTFLFIDNGGICFIYINAYCVLRFVLEFFRLGENKFYAVSYNQLVILLILLLVNIFWLLRKNKK